ncbi:MAG: DUF5615 family PIN-like protein [Bacteroidetes bacterium]|nr:DUF5615 family PIN-like protein [Bacteroidota bacterium]
MQFLIDNNISPKLADYLTQNGYNSVHVKSLGMRSSTDEEIFNYAYQNNYAIISSDSDFGFILSSWKFNHPSLLLLRHIPPRTEIQIRAILEVVLKYGNEISDGSILVISPDKLRIRKLPLFS